MIDLFIFVKLRFEVISDRFVATKAFQPHTGLK